MNNGSNDTSETRQGVLVRVPSSKIEAFKALQPWHGALTQFWLQCLDEFLELQKDHPTAAELTRQAVNNVVRERY